MGLKHKDSVDVQFMLLGNDVNNEVRMVIALPNAPVYVFEAKEASEVLYTVFWTTYEDYFEVSKPFHPNCID